MNIIIFLLIFNVESIFSSSLVILPFQINQINFKNKNYNSTELINLLFEKEYYTPIILGSDNQETFGILNFDGQHPILSDLNCQKVEKFEKNDDITKKGYIISNSKSSVFLGNGTNYFDIFKSVEVYSDQFSFYNSSIINTKHKNYERSEIVLVRDSFEKSQNLEMCLSLGLGKYHMAHLNPEPPHFVDDLYSKKKITRQLWTLKFNEENKGYLIIGDKPHEYENDTVKYYEGNYTEITSESFLTFLRIWSIRMKDIYFYDRTKDKILVNNNNNELNLLFNFGFIIGSNQYRQLIYENYFEELINKSICKLEISEKTIYNISNYYITTNGSYLMFICEKSKMNKNIINFPPLYFTQVEYRYVFELTYKDLFMAINNYYYFMIIFPDNKDNINDLTQKQYWYMGLPFLRQYQFVFNSNEKIIGFYKVKNFGEQENNENRDDEDFDTNKNKKRRVWVYILQILFILILIPTCIYIGMLINKQRKKRANELKDDDYEYIEENNNNNENKNKLIN